MSACPDFLSSGDGLDGLTDHHPGLTEKILKGSYASKLDRRDVIVVSKGEIQDIRAKPRNHVLEIGNIRILMCHISEHLTEEREKVGAGSDIAVRHDAQITHI
jgi:hypothetical protein